MKKQTNNNLNTTMVKYRCEKCNGILFEYSGDISNTIKIICKNKHDFITKDINDRTQHKKKKCGFLNIIKGENNDN